MEFLNILPDYLIYLALGISAFVENICPPIPGDTITAFGAFLVGTKRLHFFGVYLSTTLGSLFGFLFLFWIGGLLGRRFFIEKDYRFLKAKDIIRAEEWFRKYGYLLILFNRFLPGVRSAICLAGGLSRLRTSTVALLAFISCTLWNLIWISAGYMLGSNWQTAKEKMLYIMSRYNLAVLTIFGIIILFFLYKRIFKKK